MSRAAIGAFIVAIVGFGCAASKRSGTECDGGSCDVVDSAPPADAEIDAPPGHDFGEPCSDNEDCESHLCILVGTSGQCTKTCANDCPQGYGCLGVDGISIDGEITFVCVPTSSQLCTTCTMDSECTLIGMDKCVTYPDGDRACARDCSTVGCPTGFDCENVVINSVNYKQCMASSGACDCTAANSGATQQCNITTPWNVCLGTQTCAGAGGWGSCAPPSATDDPDATYTDQNCDGIDGDITRGIFVAGGGANSGTCGLTYQTPCATISHGILRAAQTSRPNVYVQTGTYNEVVVLINGINVWGGYSFNWQRGPYSNAANRVTILGAQDLGTGGSSEYMAVRAHNLIVPVTMADLIIQAPNAQGVGGNSGRDGRSSYAIHADSAQLTLTRVKIIGGNGAGGATGTNGTDAVVVDAQSFMFGSTGGPGDEFTTACNSGSRGAGGAAGTNTCSGSVAPNGGAGGSGGTMDTSCGFIPDFDARGGNAGASAASAPFPYGYRGDAGGTCANAGFGNSGLITNGGAGGAVGNGYIMASGFWYANSGGGGGTGQNGTGGGGGGGSGGCDDGTDAYGAGGGGGGAGGCAARGGGGGGGGGGASIGVFVTNGSTVAVSGCDLTRGTGGTGGAGGAGGRGQSAGGGGGVDSHPGTGAAGTGGNGAHGGHGGGGAGGAGGRSVGLMWTPGNTVTQDCVITAGSGGGGGSGGVSAPNAPLADRDGNNGSTGSSGVLEPTKICTNAPSC